MFVKHSIAPSVDYLYNILKDVIKMRLTRRFFVRTLSNLNLSSPYRYERYYISDSLRIQKKNDLYEKEILDDKNVVIEKTKIAENEFLELKKDAYKEIIRDSYLFLDDQRISIKKYYNDYAGLNRVEVEFSTIEEMNSYEKETWMGEEITNSPLAFDKYLSKLAKEEFSKELKKYTN